MEAFMSATAVSSKLQTSGSPASGSSPVAEPESSGVDTASIPTSRLPCRITAQQWDTVAVWSWNVQTRVCAICKNTLADHCINCLAKARSSYASTEATSTTAASGAPLASSSSHAAATRPLVHDNRVSATRSEASTLSPPLTTSMNHPTSATLADLSDKCCVAWGTCGHVYHYHCISRWLQMRFMCPVCGRQWQLHKVTSNE